MQMMYTKPAGWGGSLVVRYETQLNTRGKFFLAQLGQLDQKKLICMLLSLQAAPLDKVTGVSLPVCWPHAANGSKALQPFRRALATAVFLIIGTIMASDSCQQWSTSRQRGVGEVTSTQPAHTAAAVLTSKPWMTSCLWCGSESENMNESLIWSHSSFSKKIGLWRLHVLMDCMFFWNT